MKNTTLCYLDDGARYLMLHRTKKEQDVNKDKWIGIGGKFEEGESPEDCLLREVYEETGLQLTDYQYRGIVTFTSNVWGTEYMHLFTATAWAGECGVCSEGELAWVPKTEITQLPIWQGDKIFLRLLAEQTPFFSLKLVYWDDTLTEAVLNGKHIPTGE